MRGGLGVAIGRKRREVGESGDAGDVDQNSPAVGFEHRGEGAGDVERAPVVDFEFQTGASEVAGEEVGRTDCSGVVDHEVGVGGDDGRRSHLVGVGHVQRDWDHALAQFSNERQERVQISRGGVDFASAAVDELGHEGASNSAIASGYEGYCVFDSGGHDDVDSVVGFG